MTTSAIEVMQREHRDLQELFERVSDPDIDRVEVLQELLRRLAMHVSVERSVLFPVIKQHGVGGDDLPDQLLHDYRELQRLLMLIERRKANSPDVPPMVTELLDIFEAHRSRCAGVVTPGLQEVLDQQELDRLGEEMGAAEGVIVSHPHPHLLSLGPITRFTTRMAGLFDRWRDRTATGSRGSDRAGGPSGPWPPGADRR